MALTQAHLSEFRRLLGDLSASAQRALRGSLVGVDLSDGDAVRRSLGPVWSELVATYGAASASLGAVLFEAMADDLGVAPTVVLARTADLYAAGARMRWATTMPAIPGNLSTVLDELVKQPARDTIALSAHKSGGAWVRVPQGPKTCAFCRMLASRGAVHRKSADGATAAYHGHCDCATVFVRGPKDYPEGHDPDAYRKQYEAADGHNLKTVLAGMRANDSTH